MIEYEIMLDLLPYHLQQGHNINVILKVYGKIIEYTKEMFEQLEQIGNVDSKGILLDLTGQIVNENRNGDIDEIYRDRIITKIIRNISKGDIETINGLGRVLLGENYVGVFEKWNYNIEPKEAAMTLIYNFSNVLRNPTNIIKTALAGGISLDSKLQVFDYQFDFYTDGVTNLVQFPTLINP